MSPSIRASSGCARIREKRGLQFRVATYPALTSEKNTARSSARSDYCRQQAANCANRARNTALADVKDAYLQLEQAWLQLIPDFGPMPTSTSGPKGYDVDRK